MSKIQIGNTTFFYECQGQGTPLVLIAGYSCDHTFWNAIFDKLIQHFTVLIFDNRGMGQTVDTETTLSIDLMAADVMQLIKVLDLQQPIILGQSMGGMIAQTIARDYPDDISKLIILNSAAKINQRSVMMLEAFLAMLKANVPFDTLIEASMPWFYSPAYLTPQNIASYKEVCLNNPFPPTYEILSRQLAAIKKFDSNKWLGDIKVPTTVIAASEDIVCLPVESQELANKIKDSKFMTITGGHSSPLENPGELIKKLI
ncbi:MAG: alpha/beta fold hydrolase [Candidatus Berkiella sp.]